MTKSLRQWRDSLEGPVGLESDRLVNACISLLRGFYMCDLLLVSHGHTGEALLEAAAMVYGPAGPGVHALSFESGQSQEDLIGSIRQQVGASAERGGCLVLTDILGGSPFLAAAAVYGELRDRKMLQVLSGVNLAMVIEALSCRETASLSETKEKALAAAAQSICDLAQSLG